ncbi:2-hydroxychromene-2-carboxylate isomerase [Novosphingobium kunmingense]|uniref:2-hydroxychromene-2-carboxylate isomerase n=1 Tax=Novosphingobium kunmingense TaxID=1211806 RepID=A0A2N0H6Z6_9SPHN|nr:DsbA family protein [Novosphingobium kunmingense]PKB14719.1 2-hydroxychromene-2-carboxylate isomerase [Novosphingobium kunmingense]
MTHAVDLFWSFRSPYSYLVVPRLMELERDWDAAVNVRPVLPIAVRQPEFFAHADPLWTSYLMRDCVRSAEYAGMTLRWPRPDPVVMDMATRTYPTEQPHIHRLTRLGQLASERGFGLPLLREVSHLIWSGETDGWHEGDHLARAVDRAGGDLAEMDAAQHAEAARLDSAIKANEADQRLGGHYGVPLMVYEGEPFFGQDRFDQLLWRMRQNGLKRR